MKIRERNKIINTEKGRMVKISPTAIVRHYSISEVSRIAEKVEAKTLERLRKKK